MSGADLEAVERRVQQHLRASAPPLPPAVVVTVWGAMGEALPTLRRLAAVAAEGDLAVAVHSTAPSDAAVDVVRALGLRLWCALPYDPVAKELRARGHDAAVKLAHVYADRCAHHRPEVVELNGEAAWKHDAQVSMATLAHVAADCLAVTRDRCGVPLAWTSFDHLGYHPLPWGAIYGAEGVDLATPQVYAAPEDGIGGSSAARARLAAYAKQWAPLVAKGTVRADLAPGGAHHLAYGQVHHLTPAAVAMVLDSTDSARAWALPTRCDEAGLTGLLALLTARRESGRRAGAIARYQAAHGLAADGVCGPKTLAAMGLA